jgi:hypothetical protein
MSFSQNKLNQTNTNHKNDELSSSSSSTFNDLNNNKLVLKKSKITMMSNKSKKTRKKSDNYLLKYKNENNSDETSSNSDTNESKNDGRKLIQLKPKSRKLVNEHNKSPLHKYDNSNKNKSSDKLQQQHLINDTANNSTTNSDNIVLIKYKTTTTNDDAGPNSNKSNTLQRRREIHSLLIFIFFLFVTIITLSQILVMHSQTSNSNFYQIKMMQEELKLMDASIDKMLKERHVMPMTQWIALKQYNDNLKRFSNFMDDIEITNSTNYINDEFTNQTTSVDEILNQLINDLNDCKDSTKTFLAKTNSELFKVDDLNLIYTNLTNSLLDLNKTTSDVQTNDLNTSLIHSIFKKHLHLYNLTNDNVNLKELHLKQAKCLQSIIYGLFYYFNNRFTNIIEANSFGSEMRKNYFFNDFIASTHNSNINNNNNNNNKSEIDYKFKFLKTPLRNMNDFIKKYELRSSFNYNEYFREQNLCDPVPPILCNNKCSIFFLPNN